MIIRVLPVLFFNVRGQFQSPYYSYQGPWYNSPNIPSNYPNLAAWTNPSSYYNSLSNYGQNTNFYNPSTAYNYGNNLLNILSQKYNTGSIGSTNSNPYSNPEGSSSWSNPVPESNPVNNFQTPQYAPELYGTLFCVEPGKRFLSSIQHKLTHNTDITDQPEKWVCQFCENKLMILVNKICCGKNIRKRREVQELNFWFEASGQNNKLTTPNPDFEDNSEDDHLDQSSESERYHPETIFKRTMHEDCLHDLEHKVRIPDNAPTDELVKGEKEPLNHRNRRDTDELNKKDNSAWANSIRNGGKGRRTTKQLNDVVCHKAAANGFLNSLKFQGIGNTPSREEYRHTYVSRECCGIWPKDNPKTCQQEELDSSSLQEECCHEGCMYEEIVESCDAWRWNKRG